MKTLAKFLALAVFMALSACDKEEERNPRLLGAEVKLEHGSLRSCIHLKHGSPSAIGFLMSEDVLHHLPPHDTSIVLPMPAGNSTLINHIELNYSAHGHPELPIDSLPHFDMYFYLISQAERAVIDANSPAMEKLPPPQFVPQDYVPTLRNVSGMGKHWMDTTAAVHSQPFTQTMIRGSYNGKFHFYEPMITIDYLQTKPNATFPVKQAKTVSKPGGWHPTRYSIRYEAATRMYTIALDELMMHILLD